MLAVAAAVKSTAPNFEFNARLFVVILPLGSVNVAPELIVTEFVPFTVLRTDTACDELALSVNVTFAALMVPIAAVCNNPAVVAVTFKLPPTIPAFNVTVCAAPAESDTLAFVPAFKVKLVALVSATKMSPLPALAVSDAVDNKPTE